MTSDNIPLAAFAPEPAADRFAKLERDVRRLRRLVIVLAVMFLIIAARMALSSRHAIVDLVEARALLINDASGKRAIQLTADPIPQLNIFATDDKEILRLVRQEDRPVISMRTTDDADYIQLRIEAKGPHLSLGHDNTQRVALFTQNREPYVSLLDGVNHRLTMHVSKIGPVTTMYNDTGEEALKLGMARNDDLGKFAGLFINDASGAARLTVNASRNGPMIALRDEKEVSRLRIFQYDDSQGLQFYDKRGVTRSSFSLDMDAPMLELFDEKGNHSWP